MLNFFFNKTQKKKDIQINQVYSQLKELYEFETISDERKSYLTEEISKYGYLPHPHQKALEELSPAEVLFGLEIKWKNEGIFDGEKFSATKTSTLARNNVKNANWINKEGHEIKLINLAALGNGNQNDTPGKFIDWLKQLLILPTGNQEKNIFHTTIYLIPFTKREFGCAYLPSGSDASPSLEDSEIKEKLDLNVKEQIQVFITMAQLAGHPVIYDVLPQTGRFSKIILTHPEIARWFDINALNAKIENCIELVSKELERKYDKEDVQIVKNIYRQKNKGSLNEEYQKIYDEFETELEKLKKTNSREMSKYENQARIQKRVKEIVAKFQIDKNIKKLTEENLQGQNEIIRALMKEGLWTAPGGAWCSAGVPVYDKMSDCGSYPIFKHFDYKDQDVSDFANLDCQTPYYFVCLENGHFNKNVIDIFIKTLLNLQDEFNFDGFRIDHVDHIIDEVSQKNGIPISYRIPAKVLAQLNSELKKKVPYFASLAEYMSCSGYFKEYHEEMGFDILWGNDIPAQSDKTPESIIEDNQYLENYNALKSTSDNLSILKTYNNQDGEFKMIDRYPGQLGKEGAIFKWFKYKFLPGGKDAQRPILYVDGDESFTKSAIERTILSEVSMKRNNDIEFFNKFDAISRLAKTQELVTEGEAQIIVQDEDGFACWLISKEPLKTALLVAVNYLSPEEKFSLKEDNQDVNIIKEGEDIINKSITLPGDYSIKSEFVFNDKDFTEEEFTQNTTTLHFETLKPSEFKIYLLTK